MKRFAITCLVAACGGSDPAPEPTPDAPAVAQCVVTPGAAAETVSTTSGVLHGAKDGATFAFKRVPFAAPPIGDARYAPPQPVTCPSAEVDATQLGPQCPQMASDDTTFVGNEDCLQLNVWAPAAAAAPRPVMVWIHGGGNAQGSAVLPIYDGRALAEAGDVVIVTTNYRLGQLGFLASPAFGDGSGVLGLLDQIAALHWVHDNIAAFGGDPNNVTIFGESAGGRDVCSLVAATPAKGLFHRAIMESGSCRGLPSRSKAEQTGATVTDALGCTSDTLACMRAKTAEQIIRTLPPTVSSLASSPYEPMIDGVVQPDQPFATIAAGNHAHVPFIVGANADETGNSVGMITTDAQYQAAVHALLPGAIGDMALAQYPSSAYPSPRAAYVRLTTDARFVCPAREIAKNVDAHQTEPAYRYFFQFRASPAGAVHGLEVPYVFGTMNAVVLPNGTTYQPTATDMTVSSGIQKLWTDFAKTGTPNGWPLYDTNDTTLVLDTTTSTLAGIRTTQCDFWAQF